MKKQKITSEVSIHVGFSGAPKYQEDPKAETHNQAIYTRLDTALTTNHAQEFLSLLASETIHPKTLKLQEVEYYDYSAEYGREETGYALYTREETRVLDHLLYHDTEKLYEICQKILDSRSTELYKSLADAIRVSGINAERLFYVDEAMLKKVTRGIDALAKELAHDPDKKVTDDQYETSKIEADKIINPLRAKLEAHRTFENEQGPGESVALTNLKRFLFKLDFLHELRKHDSVFANHPNAKKIIANFASILLTAGIANVLNKAATGNWLFFDKTQTQEKAAKIEKNLDLKPQVK